MVAKMYQDQLKRIKKNVEDSYEYFRPNYERFNKFKKFVYQSTLDENEISALETLGKPQIEFNTCGAYISRQLGEFSKQQPSIIASAEDGMPAEPEIIQFTEGYIRHAIYEANQNGCEYNVYKDSLVGGFSVLKVWTEYVNSKSFNQVIRVAKVFNACLTGFDPLARNPDKRDGRYSFELYPKLKEEVENEYGISLENSKSVNQIDGFRWSYRTQRNKDIVLLCEYYEKKMKKTEVVQIVGGHTLTIDRYEAFLEEWKKRRIIEAPPAIINRRKSEIQTICRYIFIENQVLDYSETIYTDLPHIFVDGDSDYIENCGIFEQITRPYIYNAYGIQKLKNFAGQTLANELENMTNAKLIVQKEALPQEQSYLEAYSNPQAANVYVYNGFKDNDTNVPLPAPTTVNRTPIPPEVSQTFMMSDQTMQTVLGSYDASLGINNNQLSGVAIQEGATQSNAAAMPYIVGYLMAWTQVAKTYADLMPKINPPGIPRSVSILGLDGEKKSVTINHPSGGLSLKYPENSIKVKVEAGVNFSIQKSRSLQQLTALMQSSQIFDQFMNQMGLGVLVDNLEIRNVESLKDMAKQFMDNMQKQQAMAAQQSQQNNPIVLKQQELQLKAQKQQQDFQIDSVRLGLEQQQVVNDRDELILKARDSNFNTLAQIDKANAEKTRAYADMSMANDNHLHNKTKDMAQMILEHADMAHRHMKETIDTHHMLNKANQQQQQQPTGENENV